MSARRYNDAIDHLNSLQSNKATLEAVKASRGQLSQYAIPEMVEYLERIGYTVCRCDHSFVLTSCYVVSLCRPQISTN